MLSRLLLTLINIIFPPLTVLLLTGPYADTLINCLLFLLGVIPSHIHGFYISCTYFHRRSKVKKGKYPGGPITFIFDKEVWNGGASDRKVEELWERKEGVVYGGYGKRSGSVRSGHRERRSRAYGDDGCRVEGSERRGDRRSQMSEGVGSRSVFGEVQRRY